jgi:large repetitive protein
VLWTFCDQRLGPSDVGWTLTGIPTPDPPNTRRTSPPPTLLEVTSPLLANAAELFAAIGPMFGAPGLQPARVIGVASNDTSRLRCMRALELPELIDPTLIQESDQQLAQTFGVNALSQINQIKTRLDRIVQNWRSVTLKIGPASNVAFYLAVRQLVGSASSAQPAYNVVIREHDIAGNLLREQLLAALNPTVVTGTTGLPAQWTSPSGPWAGEVAAISSYMNSKLAALTKLFVSFGPLATTTTIEIAEIGPTVAAPSVVAGAVEVCSLSEANRYQLGLQVQQSQVSTLEGYLDGGTPVPLLLPGTTYTITVAYNVTTTEADGSQNNSTGQQAFSFQTDTAPPAKLDPWVLACTPANNELNVFYDDPVVVVFNDQEAIQLYQAYNYNLILNLYPADGLDDPTNAVASTSSVSGIGPAGYDSLLAKLGELPCVNSINVSSYKNQQFTANVQLRPCMAYTLDIVTNPAIATPPNQPIVPLYRTRFTTSKYASLADLATALGGSRVRHRHLSVALGLNQATNSAGQLLVAGLASDQDIESAFRAAGEQALVAATENAITIYWKQAGGSGPYLPYCLLIDCTEPLWRWRLEPQPTPVDPNDPSFEIVNMAQKPALEVQESGTSAIAYYLYSTSGTRTLAFLSGSGAQTITLQLHRPASTLFGLSDSAANIITLPIGAQAPWEADHV